MSTIVGDGFNKEQLSFLHIVFINVVIGESLMYSETILILRYISKNSHFSR